MANHISYNEIIVFIIRQTGWSLEYVRSLPIDILNTLTEEMSYQQAMEDYNRNLGSAMIVATMASSKTRRYSAREVLGDPPQRKGGADACRKREVH